MTDEELSDEIVGQLRKVNSLRKEDIHKVGDNVYKVLDWLKSAEVIIEKNYAYTPGPKIQQYNGLKIY